MTCIIPLFHKTPQESPRGHSFEGDINLFGHNFLGFFADIHTQVVYYADRLMMGLDNIPSLSDAWKVVQEFDLAVFTVMAQEV